METTGTILSEIYKPRPSEARKYDYGLLIVIGGAEFYSGAPALSAMAAFRAGVDMIRIIAPKRAADIIASFSPNLAAYPLNGDRITKKHVATLVEMTESAKISAKGKVAVVIGGGMGRSEETQKAIIEYLSQISIPAVIDADGIHAVAKKPEVINGKNFVFTPHAYEFAALTGKEVAGKSEEERMRLVRAEAARLKTTILLKGGMDVISNGNEVTLNRTGSPYMTVGGTGDTLAGICGAFLARGIDAFAALQAAAYLNGKAGEIAAAAKGEGLLATDLIEAIPGIIA